ncbi:MAG: adenylate/guanylate cyclase domain-containing protein [Polyangiaceae bacterium]
MFTDIEGFTSLAEKLSPEELAKKLGLYLQVMAEAVEHERGTIDKYIGDAVMAFWNAPQPVPEHARRACAAVVLARRRARELFESQAWAGLPPLVTRFGVHTASVMVGHFGAPSRLSYTALGDGVNLAARLEPLCKQYGVVAIVSEVVYLAAKDAFVFRRLDRVAVKGKTQGIDVYELVGAIDDDVPNAAELRRYEAAFELYLERKFSAALDVLKPLAACDPASANLYDRCARLRDSPPGEDWAGLHVATSK